MGQAFDRDGNVLGEAYGDTKREVFEKLIGEFKDAHEIRIRTLEATTEPVEATMRMLRERAEDGQIHIADKGVEAFIRDALTRIWRVRTGDE
jgi:hypothetical protein